MGVDVGGFEGHVGGLGGDQPITRQGAGEGDSLMESGPRLFVVRHQKPMSGLAYRTWVNGRNFAVVANATIKT